MNFKLVTTCTLSVCTIAQTSTQPAAQAAMVETPPSLAESAVSPQAAAILTQQEDAMIRTIAQPEDFVVIPEILTANAQPVTSAIAGADAPMDTIVDTTVEPELTTTVEPQAPPTQVSVQVNPNAAYRSQSPRIEVGTRGIPAVTDLPDRVTLPQDPLYPANFETPIILGQAMDNRITTTSPIIDSMADPTWSRKPEDLAAYKSAYSQNLVAWSDRVSQCMKEKPKLYVMRSDKTQLPIYFDGTEGTIVQNKDGVSICAV